LIVSWDSTTQSYIGWTNDYYKQQTAFPTDRLADTDDGTASYVLFAGRQGTGPIVNGAKLYAFSAFNETFDNAKAEKLIDLYNTRHNRTYATKGARPASADLSTIESSTCFDLDATLSTSYAGTGTSLVNIVSSPACGSDQDAFDLTAVNSPLFVGTANDQGACFEQPAAANSYFEIGDLSLATMLDEMHRTDKSGWIAFCGENVADTGLAFRTLWSNGAEAFDDLGIAAYLGSGSNIHVKQAGDASNDSAVYVNGNLENTHPWCALLSWDGATDTATLWFNSGTGENTASLTFGATTSNASSDLQSFFVWASSNNGTAAQTNKWAEGNRFRSIHGGNEYLNTDARAQAIIDHLSTRHGVLYRGLI